ncbi:hypothetical protein DKP78_21380, partial [Enterococcus faecium]
MPLRQVRSVEVSEGTADCAELYSMTEQQPTVQTFQNISKCAKGAVRNDTKGYCSDTENGGEGKERRS